jgi:hypothetical protein
MEAGGGARVAPAVAVCSGRRGQRKGASRAAVSGGGAVALGWDRKGTEELVGWRPWSSARGGHGCSACAREPRAEKRRERGVERCSSVTWASLTLEGARTCGNAVGRSSRSVATRGTHVAHYGIQLNRWQALEWPSWNTVLGLLRANLDFGPLMKFEAHSKLYDFPLGSKIIRAVDNEIISP